MKTVCLLGPVEVHERGRPVPLGGRIPTILLAALALRPGQHVRVNTLADAVWGEDALDSPEQRLRPHISRLRSRLGGLAIDRSLGTYRLQAGPAELDTLRLAVLVSDAGAARSTGDDELALSHVDAALALWRGPTLAGLADEPFARAEAARLDEQRVALEEDRLDALLRLGRHVVVIHEAEALCRTHPYRERLWATQILALYRSGRQADALRSYQQLRHNLVEHLGVEPSRSVAELELAILRHDTNLDSRGADADAALRVMVVDDHPVWRDAVRNILEWNGKVRIVAEMATGEEAVAAVSAVEPDVVLLDLNLPKMDGLETARLLATAAPRARTLMVSASGAEADVVAALQAGAHGYLVKTAHADEIADAVTRVSTGEVVFSPELAAVVLAELRGAPVHSLTADQQTAARMIADGLAVGDAATRLGVPEEDVRRHLAAVAEVLQRMATSQD